MNPDRKAFTCIAVDMGAGSIRVMLGSLKKDALELREVHRFINEIQTVEGRDTWDMDHIAREIQTGISKAVQESDQVPSSIGVDSWGVDYVLLDSHGDLVETPLAYRDKRTEGMQDKWREQ